MGVGQVQAVGSFAVEAAAQEDSERIRLLLGAYLDTGARRSDLG